MTDADLSEAALALTGDIQQRQPDNPNPNPNPNPKPKPKPNLTPSPSPDQVGHTTVMGTATFFGPPKAEAEEVATAHPRP